jgi:hypothetical protein
MLRIITLGFLVAAAPQITAGRLAVGSEPPTTPSSVQHRSYRFERDGWIYVHLEGSPFQIGFQHGSLLAPEIANFLRAIKPYLAKSTKRDWNF